MLSEAIVAGIPIISATTSDTLNVETVLRTIVHTPEGGDLIKVMPWTGSKTVRPGVLYFCIGEPPTEINATLYTLLAEQESVLILVNPTETPPEAFVAGEIPVPSKLVFDLLTDVVGKDAHKFTRAMSGLTLKQAGEVIRLTQSIYGHLTPRDIAAVRSRFAGAMQGVVPVPTHMDLFVPDPRVKLWTQEVRPFFTDNDIPSLVPRGLLLEGLPGVGKTATSKFIADQFGVPLFRLDLSSSLGKYVGESEGNLSRALNTIDQEAPCVLLIDEVEKLFAEKEDSGVTSRLLSQLLWWLQEHTSRVFTVMTTNDKDRLPPELYRPGRIDHVLWVKPLNFLNAVDLAFMEVLRLVPKADKHGVRTKLMSQFNDLLQVPHKEEYVHAEAIKAGRALARSMLTINKQ